MILNQAAVVAEMSLEVINKGRNLLILYSLLDTGFIGVTLSHFRDRCFAAAGPEL